MGIGMSLSLEISVTGAASSPGSLEVSGRSFASGEAGFSTGSIFCGLLALTATGACTAGGFVGLVTYMKQKTAAMVVLAIRRNGYALHEHVGRFSACISADVVSSLMVQLEGWRHAPRVCFCRRRWHESRLPDPIAREMW